MFQSCSFVHFPCTYTIKKKNDLNVIIDMAKEYGNLKFHRKLTLYKEFKLYKNYAFLKLKFNVKPCLL